jgi:hypothetical protein
MIRRIHVKELERAIATRPGDRPRYFRPGAHWLFGLGWTVRVEPVTATFLPLRSHGEFALLSQASIAAADLQFVRLAPHERALVWRDGSLEQVLAAGPWALWRVLPGLRVEVVDIASRLLDPGISVECALRANGATNCLRELVVPSGAVGFLLIDDVVHDELEAGRYAAWLGAGNLRLAVVPRTLQNLELQLGDVWTRDQATVKVELAVRYRIVNPRLWVESHGAELARLRGAAAAATRTVFSRRPLGRVLGDLGETALAIEAAIAEAVGERVVIVAAVAAGRIDIVRRLPRGRFRGFGDRGREVAALRDYAERPRVRNLGARSH